MAGPEFRDYLDRAYREGWTFYVHHSAGAAEAASRCPYRGKARTQWLNGWHAAAAAEGSQ